MNPSYEELQKMLEELKEAIKEFLALDEDSYDSSPLRYRIRELQKQMKEAIN